MLGRLASSAAAIEPRKQSRAMCEIFGAYGWAEGVYLEKHLADHFMVLGVNWFVPHAFSPKVFPDTDCPPHFYAHGHNLQYRCFGELMNYMNRVCTLISPGERSIDATLVYHAEAEWQGNEFTPNEKMARLLEENQIGFDIVPLDYFDEPEKYVNRNYKTVIDRKITAPQNDLSAGLVSEALFTPKSSFIRVLHIKGETEIYYFVNEGTELYTGEVLILRSGYCCANDAWENRTGPATAAACGNGTKITAAIEPRKSLFIVFADEMPPTNLPQFICGIAGYPAVGTKKEIPLASWTRSVCEGAEYPKFSCGKTVTLPDCLVREQPKFSGSVRYKTVFGA